MLAQDLLIVMRTVLAAAITVEDAALGRRAPWVMGTGRSNLKQMITDAWRCHQSGGYTK